MAELKSRDLQLSTELSVIEEKGQPQLSMETECFSINSDMSRRIKASGVLNRSVASCFTSSVFPTPVEPDGR